jgi:hypothetical protein
MQVLEFSSLVGKTLVHAAKTDMAGGEAILFETSDGERYRLFHHQDCCEDVRVDDICGDLEALLGEPLVMAEEASNEDTSDGESTTWTFYKLATPKEYVTIRWVGKSNGYYSERVDFEKWTSEQGWT